MGKYFTRMGDGSGVWLSGSEIRKELEDGMQDAVKRGKVVELTQEELDKMYEIMVDPNKVVSVERGNEVVHTYDGGTNMFGIRGGVPVSRLVSMMAHERAFCSDSMELSHIDYSYKALKNIAFDERNELEQILYNTVMPVFYGAMPNIGLYTKPDGPIDNWAELLPMAKIKEAMEAQEEAIEHCVKDMVYVSEIMEDAGADGINFDSVGGAGDADVMATLQTVEILRNKYPDLPIEVGMAGEFILGMHGDLKYDGKRLAGLYPHEQVKLFEAAGATVFGPVINTNSNKTFAWNIARATAYTKACVEASSIPVHPNCGMGVGGMAMAGTAGMDEVSRANKILVEIGKADGL